MRTFSLLRFGQGGESTRFGTAESEIQQPIPVALAEMAKTPETVIGCVPDYDISPFAGYNIYTNSGPMSGSFHGIEFVHTTMN